MFQPEFKSIKSLITRFWEVVSIQNVLNYSHFCLFYISFVPFSSFLFLLNAFLEWAYRGRYETTKENLKISRHRNFLWQDLTIEWTGRFQGNMTLDTKWIISCTEQKFNWNQRNKGKHSEKYLKNTQDVGLAKKNHWWIFI